LKILIVRFSSLGDLITQEVAFRAIRHFYPDAHITFLTSPTGKALYEDGDYFDDFVVFDGNYLQTNNALRQNDYDMVFNLQCNRPSHFLLTGVKYGQLFNQSGSLWQKLLYVKTKPVWMPQMLELSGIPSEKLSEYYADQHSLKITLPHSNALARDIVAMMDKTKYTVCIAPGASQRWESKKWGDERYGELAKRLIKQGCQVVLIGSKLEAQAGALIAEQNPQVISLIAKTMLGELKSVLANADLLVANDSGPAHLAAGVGTDTLTLFGSTDVKHCVKFDNYDGAHDYLVSSPLLGCQPCYKSKCPTKHECMKAITVEAVVQKISEIMDGKQNV